MEHLLGCRGGVSRIYCRPTWFGVLDRWRASKYPLAVNAVSGGLSMVRGTADCGLRVAWLDVNCINI